MSEIILNGRYKILEKIGEGGMATVFKAMDVTLERLVAVKVLKNEYISDMNFISKFKAEALAAGKLNDNNIVGIYDAGTHEKYNYIVMEYVKGKTLKEVIKEKAPFENSEIIDKGIQIAKALRAAHRNNIIHRDIKPHNILVTEYGVLKITDFGIAKAKSVSETTIANTNTVIGSVHYISPEQAKGEIVDLRTDLYSLGVVLYEMATGRVPFDADVPVTVAIKHIQEEVTPPINLGNNLSQGVNSLILKLLQKDPMSRYQDIEALYDDLKALKEGKDITIENKSFDKDKTMILETVKVPTNPVDEVYSDDLYDEEEEYAESETKSPMSKRKKIGLITSIVLVTALVLYGVWTFAGSLANKDDKVKLPNFVGSQIEEVIAELEELGLKAEENYVESTKPEGEVLASYPEAGEMVAPGRTIKLDISLGEKQEVMPNFVDKDIDIVKAQLDKLNVKYEIKEENNDDFAKGRVISQDIAEGTTIEEGQTINLVVSLGANPKDVNLIGKTSEEAQKIAMEMGFILSFNENKESSDPNDKNNDGKIIEQDKTTFVKGDTITVTILSYKEKIVKVPNLIGISESDARKAIENSNLKVGSVTQEYNDTVEKGKVISQSPEKGTELAQGSSVNFVVSKGPENTTIPVPPLVGKTLTEAKNLIVQSGFTVGDIKYPSGTDTSDDSIFVVQSQSVAQGVGLYPNSPINLVVTVKE